MSVVDDGGHDQLRPSPRRAARHAGGRHELMRVSEVVVRGDPGFPASSGRPADVVLRGQPSDRRAEQRLGEVHVLLASGESLPAEVVVWEAMSTSNGIVLLALGVVVEHPQLCRAARVVHC